MIHATTLATIAVLSLGVSAPGGAGDEDKVVVHSRIVTAEDGDAQILELHGVNQDMKVIINGEEVDPGRIQHKDGRIVILDEKGEEVHGFGFGGALGEGEFKWDLQFGGDFDKLHEQIQLWRDQGTGHQELFVAEAPKTMIGVHLGEPSEPLIRHLKLTRGETTIINGVLEGLPARKAGIDAYDIIVAINGKTPAGPQQVHEAIAQLNPGDSIALTVIHEGQRKAVTVNVAAYDADALHGAEVIGEGASVGLWRRMPTGVMDIPNLEGLSGEMFVLPPIEHHGPGHSIVINPRLDLKLRKQAGSDDVNIEQEIEDGLEDAVKADMADLGERLQRLEELLKKLSEKNKKDQSDE